MAKIQWYPGHIAKLERQLKDHLKQVDVVIEVRDARIPLASTNPRLKEHYGNKPSVILLNKADLADKEQTRQWLEQLQSEDIPALFYDAKQPKDKGRVLSKVTQCSKSIQEKRLAKGLKPRPVRAMILGMPNVGKSTVINSLVKRKKAATGHKAGVTRNVQWIRVLDNLELMDTPGLIPPSLESEDVGYYLACVSSVSDATFDEEDVTQFLLEKLQELYPGKLAAYYKTDAPVTLEKIAASRNMLISGNQPDLTRAARTLLTDFRQGKLGPMTLEQVEGSDNG